MIAVPPWGRCWGAVDAAVGATASPGWTSRAVKAEQAQPLSSTAPATTLSSRARRIGQGYQLRDGDHRDRADAVPDRNLPAALWVGLTFAVSAVSSRRHRRHGGTSRGGRRAPWLGCWWGRPPRARWGRW